MFRDELQKKIHEGDRDAFRIMYNRYSKKVYSLADAALDDSDAAKDAVKQVFMKLYRDLIKAESDLDISERLSALTNEEIRLARVLKGDISQEALQVFYLVTAEEDPNYEETMVKVRSRMISEEPGDERPRSEKNERVPRESAKEAPEMWDEPPEAPPRRKKADRMREGNDPDGLGLQEKKRGAGSVIVLLLLLLLVLAFVWLLAGILMDMKIIPFIDLGYTLFNTHVFNFFKIPN